VQLEVGELLRALAPQVLGAIVRRHGDFDTSEDAVQEALVAAFTQWPTRGVPANPRGWLITVANRRMTDEWRSESARRRRELTAATLEPLYDEIAEDAGADAPEVADDSLTLIFMCCHPALSETSQLALTLRAVGGLTTAQIAKALLVPEATLAQRISRAKQTIKTNHIPFSMPDVAERETRLQVVLHVLYLIFNEGYTSTAGPDLQRPELTREAIRLARELRRLLPEDGEVAGLLALMLLTDARRPARTLADGSLVPLAEQDRGNWNRGLIEEGVALITESLATRRIGPFQLQAAIAAVHDEAATADETDWRQILALYMVLERTAPNPMVTLNRAVALSMVEGPQAGLALLEGLTKDERLRGNHRLDAVRAHMLEQAGERERAMESYRLAASRTTSLPKRRYLEGKAERLRSSGNLSKLAGPTER
jgi:RNA polymerase sigma factor (sigma-70 family)